MLSLYKTKEGRNEAGGSAHVVIRGERQERKVGGRRRVGGLRGKEGKRAPSFREEIQPITRKLLQKPARGLPLAPRISANEEMNSRERLLSFRRRPLCPPTSLDWSQMLRDQLLPSFTPTARLAPRPCCCKESHARGFRRRRRDCGGGHGVVVRRREEEGDTELI